MVETTTWSRRKRCENCGTVNLWNRMCCVECGCVFQDEVRRV